MTHSTKYQQVLKSKRWKEFAKYAVHIADKKCQRCNMSKKLLEVHHLHYETLGNETLKDVQVVCLDCHPKADLEREKESSLRCADRQFENGYDTYMRKKYGDGFYADHESRRDYSEWLEMQQ